MHLAVEQNRRRFYKRNFGLMSVYKKQKQTTIVIAQKQSIQNLASSLHLLTTNRNQLEDLFLLVDTD